MSREKILNTIRQNDPVISPEGNGTEIPGIIAPEGLKALFKQVVKQVGGKVVELKSKQEADAYIREHFSESPDFENTAIWNEYSPSSPLDKLDKTESAVLCGQVGVAENGAIWIDENNFPHRLIPFVVQHLVIRLQEENITDDLHSAYKIINTAATGFGVFISGPSKTADIEQSLVYGAHGAKELTVLLYRGNN